MADNRRIQTRIDEGLAEWLQDRTGRMHTPSHHEQARIELGMWRSALAAELRRVRLTLAQASCVADVMNGYAMSPIIGMRPGIVYAECYDAFEGARNSPFPEESSYQEKWSIDEQALLKYLADLSPFADHALADAVNRWWTCGHEPTIDGFAAVGLRLIDTGDGQTA